MFNRLVALLLLVVSVSMGGCMAAGGGGTVLIPTTLKQTSTLDGQGVIGSLLVGNYPFTYSIRWSGQGSLTLQYPATPHVLLEGNITWEPVVPAQRGAILAEMSAGRFAVREVR